MDGDSATIEQCTVTLKRLLKNTDLDPKLTFIGGGKMAVALICGFETSGLVTKDDVAVSVKTVSSAKRWENLGYTNVYTSNEFMLQAHNKGIVFLSVKPQVRMAVLEELSSTAFANTPLIVSVMGGVNLETLEKEVAAKGYIVGRGLVRLMPNLPVSLRCGASIICFSSCLVKQKIDLIKYIMRHVGICLAMSEKSFDAAAAVAGCGPAFMFMAIEALSDGGVLGGVDRRISIKLAAQTVMGAARMILEATEHPAVLKDDVCSAGGSTIYGVKELEKNGFRSALIEAVHAATKRSSSE
uniref:Pyrroline-5-carboxylate reductase n=1 Tax=Elaeophora elaphi TaxID=1147741 RepID=A0A0R3RQA6_9BILA